MGASGSDPRCPESFVKRAAALRAKSHVPHCTGALEWVITPDTAARLVAEGLPCATFSSFLLLLHFVVEQGGNRQHG